MLGAGEALKRLAVSDQPSDRSRETRVESREPRAGEKRRTGESAKRRRGDKERGEETGNRRNREMARRLALPRPWWKEIVPDTN